MGMAERSTVTRTKSMVLLKAPKEKDKKKAAFGSGFGQGFSRFKIFKKKEKAPIPAEGKVIVQAGDDGRSMRTQSEDL